MKNKNMENQELVNEESISISFVNGQITDIRGTGYVPSDITDDFTGTLIYKNNKLSKVIGFGHLGRRTSISTSTTNLCLGFEPSFQPSPKIGSSATVPCKKCGRYFHQHPAVSYTIENKIPRE